MAQLLLNLRNVPDDEADEVRALFDAEGIDYYETKPSLWGISGGGIWLAEPSQQERALALLVEYQAQRAGRARSEREAALREGRAPSSWDGIRAQPAQALAAIIGILLMIAVATLPFMLYAR